MIPLYGYVVKGLLFDGRPYKISMKNLFFAITGKETHSVDYLMKTLEWENDSENVRLISISLCCPVFGHFT